MDNGLCTGIFSGRENTPDEVFVRGLETYENTRGGNCGKRKSVQADKYGESPTKLLRSLMERCDL